MARHTKHPLTPTECKWRRLVAEWRDSGMSAQEFAESKHINAGTLEEANTHALESWQVGATALEPAKYKR